jgi:hypothetical protein
MYFIGFKVQSKVMRAQKRNLLVMKFLYVHRSEFLCRVQKRTLWGSEIQPGVMTAQKREIKISLVTYLLIKNFIFSVKKCTFRGFHLELELFSKFNRKHVTSFMNRKSSCNYEINFLL